MRQTYALALFGLGLLFGPMAHAGEGTHLVVSNLHIENPTTLSVSKPYQTSLDLQVVVGDQVEISALCFFWSTAKMSDGPHCFDQWQFTKEDNRNTTSINLFTGRAGTFTLTAFALYAVGGQQYFTNQLQTKVVVR